MAESVLDIAMVLCCGRGWHRKFVSLLQEKEPQEQEELTQNLQPPFSLEKSGQRAVVQMEGVRFHQQEQSA